MTGYQIDVPAVYIPSPEDVAEAAALFAAMAREAAGEAVGGALDAVAEVLAAFADTPLLGEFFDEWADAELDALTPADRLEATAADFEQQDLAEIGVNVRAGGASCD